MRSPSLSFGFCGRFALRGCLGALQEDLETGIEPLLQLLRPSIPAPVDDRKRKCAAEDNRLTNCVDVRAQFASLARGLNHELGEVVRYQRGTIGLGIMQTDGGDDDVFG